MWIRNIKMVIGTIGLAILVVAGLMIRVTEKDQEPFSNMWYNLLELWEDMKTNVYGG